MTVLGPFSKVNSLVAEKLRSTMYVLILVGANKADYSTEPKVGLPVDQWRKRPCRARGNKTTHAAVSLGF